SAPAKSKLTVALTETPTETVTERVIENTGDLIQQIPELLPQTEYTATVSVLCDEEYVESLSTTVTTSAVPAPTNLSAVAVWEEIAGKVTISWIGEDDLTYEIDGEGVKESGFEKEGLAVGNYTARVRARYQNPNNSEDFYYSDWSEIAYTVSNPPAPSNPQISFAHQENGTADVTITWIAGSDDSPTWIIKEGETQLATGLSSATYTISGRNVGSSFTIKISEKTTPGTSEPLLVNVTVPCANATLPENIETNQTTATFTFASEQTDRKIVIGGYEHDASSASVTLSNLSSGTNYNYTIREYCTTTLYSEVSSTFVTKSCYAVTGLQAQATGVTSGSASWTSQSELSGLNYKVRLLQGENEISSTEQPETSITFSGLQPSTTYTVEVSEQCGDAYGYPRTIPFTTESSTFITKQSGDFNDPNTWTNKKVPQGNVAYITIAPGHKLKLSGDLTITNTYKIVSNQGVLEIPAGKQLINTTDENVGGIIEVSTPQKTVDQWTFIGAPFKSGYKLGSIKPVSGSDVAMVEYNYTDGEWSNYFVNYETTMAAAEGAFAWMFYNGVVTFSTYDLGQNGTSYPDNAVADYALNNTDVTVTENLINSEGGYWMALANPYPAKLNVSKFLGDNNTLQGNCVYVFRNGTFDMDAGTNGTQGLSSGDIDMTEGFFVNFTSGGNDKSVTFKKSQLTNWPTSSSKSEVSPREFIELTLQNGKDKVRVYFAHNEDAEQGYDIFDANKMFATTGVAEPYFVTDGIALIKEEVRDLPYYATMNVRSQEDTVMSFVLTNLPEGYAVSIIDGEEVIDLVEGGVYSTEIASGENADRFKVLVKKNVGLADVEELDVRITNSNRHITITAQENVRTEVYNTLGQKVFETEETNFVLSGVASGAYVVKVQGAKASKSQKIVVE
ncbi:MAG: T9SS type A sorting domain-containing protein, partial [Bacteroidales bacterium]|nr:T9SS type A sorting domain-containing protein [Bacteroidales bacterium]